MTDTNSSSHHNEWDVPLVGPPANARKRASFWVWVIGGVEVVAFGFCGLFLSVMSRFTAGDFEQALTPEQLSQYSEVQPMLKPAAVTFLVLGFIPGLVYVLLGFKVRNGNRRATTTALILAMTQGLVFGVLFLSSVLHAVGQGDPAALTINVLTLGSLLGLLGIGTHRLWQTRTDDEEDGEPIGLRDD